ncbi:MAG: hypothetical protein JOY90_28305 [Bradyrhizobium sp.]|uniref:hypothetical protein n=1 Tax=Bradyrhizobium sp. TaxID=376 RepID=UPI001D44D9FE|nr:hypothetical protein [Bradyrhizobium sp.]MBV9564312.1 hypothetical protein [Bradyrhizobium sp.]
MAGNQERQVFDLMDGAVRVWVEQEAIHLIAVERPHLDPVELTGAMAKRLAEALNSMADQLDD